MIIQSYFNALLFDFIYMRSLLGWLMQRTAWPLFVPVIPRPTGPPI